jgi:hypothetical protein
MKAQRHLGTGLGTAIGDVLPVGMGHMKRAFADEFLQKVR